MPDRTRIYFISDAHLGATSSEQENFKESRLSSFLQRFPQHDARLVICGDLFDFWFEYRHVVPRRHFNMLARLARLSELGIPIDYIAGNHDFWLGTFLEEIGITVHRDDMVIEQENDRIYICHGDGLLKNDYLYRLLKKILRFRINVTFYSLLHPDFGIPMALFFSRCSRNAAKYNNEYNDEDYRTFARQQLKQGYTGVVLGHTHIAALENFQGGWYVNPGDWVRSFTYAVVDKGQPALYLWDGEKGHPFKP